MNINVVKVAKVVGMTLSIGAGIVTEWVRDKQMDTTIAKKVGEALANKK